ncbi:MAG: hypothetical protein JNK97_16730 [Zoogloea sp.]|nr:hypothetical protein [Zoogloea sp.]
MQLELIIPGLSWLAAAPGRHPAHTQPLPALATLLGFARSRWAEPASTDTLLADALGLAGTVSHAVLRRSGEPGPGPTGGGHWLCCDPVHLHFARDTLLLADASGLAITRQEADTLMAGLNDTFADIGHFEAPAPDRWYVHLVEQPAPRFHPLADVNGRPVQLFLPEGEDISRWARLSNEIEVWLYSHPVNAAREETGQRKINGIWLWGAGPQQAPCTPRISRLQASQPYALGLARLAGLTPDTHGTYTTPTGPALALLDTLQRPALHHDRDAWLHELRQLETHWFAPLLTDLKARRLDSVRIRVPDDRHLLEVDIAASGLWKFWRKPQPLDALLATAPQPKSSTP